MFMRSNTLSMISSPHSQDRHQEIIHLFEKTACTIFAATPFDSGRSSVIDGTQYR
jgi:hypothetical protein